MEIDKKTNLILILFSFIFLNLSLFIYLQVPPFKQHSDVDSSAYLEKAEILYKNGTFAPTPVFENLPYYTLGYPIIVALTYKLLGEAIGSIIFLQLILVLLSAFLIFLTARRVFNETVGVIAFSLTCLNVGFIVFAQFILTEILLVFFLILFFERFCAYLKNRQEHFALYFSGGMLGLSVIVKPAALYFPIFIVPLLYFLNKFNIDKFRIIITFLAAFLLPILGYMAHNKIVFDEFRLSKMESQNLYFWFYPNVLAAVHGSVSDVERSKLQLVAGSNYERIDVVKKMFWDDFKVYPIILYFYVWGKNVGKTFLGLFTTNLKVLVEPNIFGGDISFFKMRGTPIHKAWNYIESGTMLWWIKTVGLLEAIWSLMRYFLCVTALIWLINRKRWALAYFFTTFIFYFSMITGHDGCARFRMMFEFVLIILAALGIFVVLKHFQCGKNANILKAE